MEARWTKRSNNAAARNESLDVFGASGATEQSVVQRAGFERAHGIDSGTMTGIGAALRPSMGGAQANTTVMKLQASLIASGIKDAIGPYLETAASMLTELNEKGFTMDDSVLSLFNQMVKAGHMGEGQAKTLMTGADQAIRGSSGESNAFFQSVFHKAGIGGNSIGGIQAAMEMGGLFGANLDKYKGNITPAAEGLNKRLKIGDVAGQPSYMQKVSGSLLTMLKDSTGGQKGDQALLSKYRFMKNLGLAKNIGQAEMVEKMLQTAADPRTSAKERGNIQKQLANIQDENKDPSLSELKNINSSTAGIYDVLRGKNKTQLDEIGNATGNGFNTVDQLLTSIDGGILALAKTFTGYKSPKELNAMNRQKGEDAKRNAKEGYYTDPKDIEKLPLKEQMDLQREVKQKADIEKQRGWLRNRSYENLLSSGALDQAAKQNQTDDKLRNKSSTPDHQSAQYKKALDLVGYHLSKISHNTGATATNTKGGGIPASSSSTTGTGQ